MKPDYDDMRKPFLRLLDAAFTRFRDRIGISASNVHAVPPEVLPVIRVPVGPASINVECGNVVRESFQIHFADWERFAASPAFPESAARAIDRLCDRLRSVVYRAWRSPADRLADPGWPAKVHFVSAADPPSASGHTGIWETATRDGLCLTLKAIRRDREVCYLFHVRCGAGLDPVESKFVSA